MNAVLYAKTCGRLEPKAAGREFRRAAYYGEEVYYGDGNTYGESETNAAIMHQRDSAKYPSSGISTTPILENAKSYATHSDIYQRGYVYKIDTDLLAAAGVKAYPVSDHAIRPAIPGDQEVILVAADNGALPQAIIVETIQVVT